MALHWKNHTDELLHGRTNLMWTVHPSLLAPEDAAGTWHFRAQEEPAGHSIMGQSQDPSATLSSELINVRQT